MYQDRKSPPSVEIWSRGRLQFVPDCPACGAADRVKTTYCRRDDMEAMPDTWCMVKCAYCGSLFLDPRPDADSLPLAYQDYYTHGVGEEREEREKAGTVSRLVNGYLAWRFGIKDRPHWRIGAWLFALLPPLRLKLDVYGRHVPRGWCGDASKRLLDVGCGNGDYMLRAQEMGLSVRGCEPDPRAVTRSRERGLDVVNGDAFSSELDGQEFDMVTLNHVIEHVDDPVGLLDQLFDRLAPGGVLWMALPNPEALGIHLYGAAWKGFHPPFHLLIPRQRILEKWLHQSGFEKVKLLRRGAQSPGLWRESGRIAKREGGATPLVWSRLARAFGDLICTVSSRWGEETIIVARRPE